MIIYILIALLSLILIRFNFSKKKEEKESSKIVSVNIFKLIYYFINNVPLQTRDSDLIVPLFKKYKYINYWFTQWFIMVADLETIHKILSDTDNFSKFMQDGPLEQIELLGDNIANIDGEEWKRHRRMINPIFKRGWDINVFFNIGINLIQHIQLNQTNKQFDLLSTLKRAALDSLGLSVFDVEFNYIENETNEMARLYVKLINAMDNIWFYVLPVLNYLPISSRLTLKKDAKRFRQLIQLMIDEKRQQLQQVNINDIQPNLLTTLVQASDNNTNDNGLTDEEIINDMIAFFIAGHDTTAHTISTILYYLSKNQDIQTKLRDEIYQIVGEKIKDSNKLHTITQDEINQMIYLEAVISESMRILPTVNMLPRKCTKDYYFENEIYFKKGQPLMLNFALAMKGNAHFKNPEEFNPNRFLIVNELGNLSINKKLTKELLGFGYGPRMCIGSQFSLLEQKVFLILILSTFNVELPENSPHYDNPTLPALGFISPKDLKLNFVPI